MRLVLHMRVARHPHEDVHAVLQVQVSTLSQTCTHCHYQPPTETQIRRKTRPHRRPCACRHPRRCPNWALAYWTLAQACEHEYSLVLFAPAPSPSASALASLTDPLAAAAETARSSDESITGILGVLETQGLRGVAHEKSALETSQSARSKTARSKTACLQPSSCRV